MTRFLNILLPCSLVGLMFCIIPIPGMEVRLSWQLVAIWLGGVAFATFLSSWWWRGFFLLALLRTATIIPPSYDSYISLLMIAIFLAAAEGFSRINPDNTMDGLCIAAVALIVWIALQQIGWTRLWFGTGPFNPVSAGVFLALCLPATLRRNWWPLFPIIMAGIVVIGSSTGMIAAICGCFIFCVAKGTIGKKELAITAVALMLLLSVWFWRVDSMTSTGHSQRLIAWKHAAVSMQTVATGRGLGSWELVFPLLASGDKRVGNVTNEGNKLIMSNVFAQAHNEYVQTAFELGVQTVLLITGFLIFVGWMILFKPVSPHAAAGIVTVAVACFGWHLFHIAPLALLGVAWLGIWRQDEKLSPIVLPKWGYGNHLT